MHATKLHRGSMLRTSVGTWVKVEAVKRFDQHRRFHNLAVDGLHTYCVVAGETPVLGK